MLFSISVSAQSGKTYNIKNYGAVGDGKTLESPAINKAIDAAAANGGGTVYILLIVVRNQRCNCNRPL